MRARPPLWLAGRPSLFAGRGSLPPPASRARHFRFQERLLRLPPPQPAGGASRAPAPPASPPALGEERHRCARPLGICRSPPSPRERRRPPPPRGADASLPCRRRSRGARAAVSPPHVAQSGAQPAPPERPERCPAPEHMAAPQPAPAAPAQASLRECWCACAAPPPGLQALFAGGSGGGGFPARKVGRCGWPSAPGSPAPRDGLSASLSGRLLPRKPG